MIAQIESRAVVVDGAPLETVCGCIWLRVRNGTTAVSQMNWKIYVALFHFPRKIFLGFLSEGNFIFQRRIFSLCDFFHVNFLDQWKPLVVRTYLNSRSSNFPRGKICFRAEFRLSRQYWKWKLLNSLQTPVLREPTDASVIRPRCISSYTKCVCVSY